MKRFIGTLIVLGLIGFGISFVAAPWFAFRALRAAAAAEDVQAVAGLVDFNAVRQSLRSQVGEAAPNTPPPSVWSDPIGAMKRALEPIAPRPDVDAMLTPRALAELTQADTVKDASPWRVGALLPGLDGTELRYWGPNRTRIAVAGPAGDTPEKETLFTFERRSLFSWKLVHISLPAPRQPQS